ncbi:hypothetical protein B0H14DRAFT_2578389 [Mycena olivaceomarginata]|nr:hypothetical protein B0H14DRAFT_2578389 [Mycena olivaceomarginata]
MFDALNTEISFEEPTDAPSHRLDPSRGLDFSGPLLYPMMRRWEMFSTPIRRVTYFPAVSAPVHHLFPGLDDILYLPTASKSTTCLLSIIPPFFPQTTLKNFDWSFLDDFGSGPTDASITSSFDGAASFSARFSAPASPPRLPPIPISPSPPPVPLVAPPAAKPLSRKRKNDIDGLDPANVLEGQSWSRRVRKRSS